MNGFIVESSLLRVEGAAPTAPGLMDESAVGPAVAQQLLPAPVVPPRFDIASNARRRDRLALLDDRLRAWVKSAIEVVAVAQVAGHVAIRERSGLAERVLDAAGRIASRTICRDFPHA